MENHLKTGRMRSRSVIVFRVDVSVNRPEHQLQALFSRCQCPASMRPAHPRSARDSQRVAFPHRGIVRFLRPVCEVAVPIRPI